MSIELALAMREKEDVDGRKYLFASIPEYNLVVFVYDDTDAKPGLHTLKVKPYRGRKGQTPPDDGGTWPDPTKEPPTPGGF